jgi:hypothetical protein
MTERIFLTSFSTPGRKLSLARPVCVTPITPTFALLFPGFLVWDFRSDPIVAVYD